MVMRVPAVFLLALVAGMVFVSLPEGKAQTVSGSLQDRQAMNDLLQGLSDSMENSMGAPRRFGDQPQGAGDPWPGPRPAQDQSRLEDDYRQRLDGLGLSDLIDATLPATRSEAEKGEDGTMVERLGGLRQYGYDLFTAGQRESRIHGAVAEDYVMGPGDTVVISLRGSQTADVEAAVDREGVILISDLPPIQAAGRSFGDVRDDIQRRVEDSYVSTTAFVSLGGLRQISVVVAGDVVQPGAYQLSGLATVIDALLASGGVRKAGTLRRIILRRGGRQRVVDLYDLLQGGGAAADAVLRSGDRLLVESVGPTLAVAGDVVRSAIYEFPAGTRSLGAEQAIALAGGTLRPTGYRYVLVRPMPSGEDEVRELDQLAGTVVQAGDILLALRRSDDSAGAFSLDGHITVPGLRSLARTPTLSALLREGGLLKSDPYTLLAVIQRTDPVTLTRYLMPVSLADALRGTQDVRLQNNDRVVVFSRSDIRFLSSPLVQNILIENRLGVEPLREDLVQAENRETSTEELVRKQADVLGASGEEREVQELMRIGFSVCRSLGNLRELMSTAHTRRFAGAVLSSEGYSRTEISAMLRRASIQTENTGSEPLCPRVFETMPSLLPFLLDYAVLAQGEVTHPSVYPVPPQTPLSDVIALAGGLAPGADTTDIELLRFQGAPATDAGRRSEIIDLRAVSLQQLSVAPGDVVRVNPVYTGRGDGPVLLTGEVRKPGYYTIRRGERLSEVIGRAGGLTDYAYPLGGVLARESVKAEEKKGLQRLAREMESSAIHAAAKLRREDVAISVIAQLTERLRDAEPVGRLVAEMDPAVLAVEPDKDLLLEAGDRIYIPKRPNHVMVIGEVLNAGAQMFESGATASDYVRLSGGYSQTADEGRTFIILPNGGARPVGTLAWNYDASRIPPGSTVVVPRDPSPFNFQQFLLDWFDILSKGAISYAALKSLLDDD